MTPVVLEVTLVFPKDVPESTQEAAEQLGRDFDAVARAVGWWDVLERLNTALQELAGTRPPTPWPLGDYRKVVGPRFVRACKWGEDATEAVEAFQEGPD